jgi:hypothetical protein
VVDVFVDGLDLAKQGFDGVQPEATGRPSYHPAVMLTLFYRRVPQSDPIQPAPGTRPHAAQTLVLRLSHVPDQGARHDQQLSPDHPLGARGCAGAYAGSTGASPGGLEAPTINRGVRVWHAHGMDGERRMS